MLGCFTGNNPDTEGEIVAAAWLCVERTQFMVDSMKNRVGAVFGCIGDQDREFISPKPRQQVGLPERIHEHPSGVHEGTVPFLVAEGVVDLLHAVKIDKADQKWLSCPVSQLHVMSRQSQEPAPITEPGQIVDMRKVDQL